MRYVVLILLGVLLWSGCGLFSSDKEVIVTSIQEELQLELWNPLATPSQFALSFSTLASECPGTEISTSYSHVGKTINVVIHGLLENNNCVNLAEPAQRLIPVNISAGSYNLVLRLGPDIVNQGTMVFDGEVYSLEMISNFGLILGETELHRIPYSIVWGQLSSDTEAVTESGQLHTTLGAFGTQPDLPSGYYGHYTIDVDGKLVLSEDSGKLFQYPFMLALDTDVMDLEAAIDAFRAQLDPSVTLVCHTWSGIDL